MKYFNIYETTDKAKFDAVIELFESHDIHYQKLFDYRLFREKIHDSFGEPAIIRVNQHDLMKANHLLISGGFKSQTDKNEVEFKFIKKQRRIFKRIPLLKNWSGATQFISATFITIFLLLLFLTIGITRSKKMPIEEKNWCVQSISKEEKPLYPNTDEVIIIIGAGCKEYLYFHKDGSVMLPGFKTKKVLGFWEFLEKSKKKIRIFDVDNFEDIYEGTYDLKFNKLKGEIILSSDKTKMILKK